MSPPSLVSSRCVECGGKLFPTMRRCRRCGATIDHEQTFPVVTLARPPAPYASGDLAAGRYLVVENYGSGPLGTTYRARTTEGRAVALKVLSPSLLTTREEQEAFLHGTRSVMRGALDHVALPLDAGFVGEGLVFVVSPWVHGASLRRILQAYQAADRRLDHDQAFGVLQGVAAALRELHTVSSHGAIYPETIRVNAEGVTLVDASLVAHLHPGRFSRYLEHFDDVLPYLAPEVRAGKRAGAAADLHAVGALAAELFTGDAARARTGKLGLSSLGPEAEAAMRALVSAQVPRRVAAFPQLLDRLSLAVGEPSLPRFAQLPWPFEDQRTRRIAVRERLPTGGPPLRHGRYERGGLRKGRGP